MKEYTQVRRCVAIDGRANLKTSENIADKGLC